MLIGETASADRALVLLRPRVCDAHARRAECCAACDPRMHRVENTHVRSDCPATTVALRREVRASRVACAAIGTTETETRSKRSVHDKLTLRNKQARPRSMGSRTKRRQEARRTQFEIPFSRMGQNAAQRDIRAGTARRDTTPLTRASDQLRARRRRRRARAGQRARDAGASVGWHGE
jgi:hypothetical protein